MACQDLAGTGRHADFDYFSYRERDFRAHPFPDLADALTNQARIIRIDSVTNTDGH
jgi:hypothetical protein